MDQQVSRGGDWIDDDEIVLDANESFDDDFDDVGDVDDVGRVETEVCNAAKSAAAEAPNKPLALRRDGEGERHVNIRLARARRGRSHLGRVVVPSRREIGVVNY